MGFKAPSLNDAYTAVGKSLTEIHSPYNDGWTSCACKKELYLLKCWLQDQYTKLPTFAEEQEWEQQRLITILKK